MDHARAGLDALTRRERVALRALLIRATAVAGRSSRPDELMQLVRAAPIGALPAAARLHRFAGSVRRGLDGIDGVLADDVVAELTTLQQRASIRHLLVTGALSQIGRDFGDADLSWIAMKGPVVAALLYPGIGDRSYGDLDLLVDRRDFPKAVRILESLGFEHSVHNWALAEEMLAGQILMSNQVVSVDLHWHLHYSRLDRRPYDFDPGVMLGRRRFVAVSGMTAPTFDQVDTLLVLAFHAARSDGHRLVWFKDIERAVAVDEPDLDELVRRCQHDRCAAPIGVILSRARSLVDAEIPDEIIRELASATLRAADRVAVAVSHPVQLHERATVTRAFTRSVRSSAVASLFAAPARVARRLRRRLLPPPENETDSPDEKERYLAAVSTSVDQ